MNRVSDFDASLQEDREAARRETEREALNQLEKAKASLIVAWWLWQIVDLNLFLGYTATQLRSGRQPVALDITMALTKIC